jgi:hypothetical protein
VKRGTPCANLLQSILAEVFNFSSARPILEELAHTEMHYNLYICFSSVLLKKIVITLGFIDLGNI